jgi:FkbM family methyltransferase
MRRILAKRHVNKLTIAFRPFTDDVDKTASTYETNTRSLIDLHNANVAIDVGANIGVLTLWISRIVGPTGKVLALEPEPDNFQVLQYNVGLNSIDNVVPLQVALGSATGHASMWIPSPSEMGRVGQIPSGHPKSRNFQATLTTLDLLAASCNLTTIDLIKIDVEGGELSVLKGGTNSLRKFGPKLIIEVHGPDSLARVMSLLHSLNFRILSKESVGIMENDLRSLIYTQPDWINP